MAVLMSLALIVGPHFAAVPRLRGPGVVSGLVVLAAAVIALRTHHTGRFVASAKALLAGMVLLQAPLWLGVLPALEEIKVTPAIGRVVNHSTPKNVPAAAHRFHEPSLNFYVGREIQNLPPARSVVDWAGEGGPGVLVIPKKDFEQIEHSFGALPVAALVEKRGFNSKGTPVDILALMRKGGIK